MPAISMTVVIDCSALVRALTDHGPAGFAVRGRLGGMDALAAPGLLDYQIISALFGMVRGGKLTEKEAVKAIADYQALAITRHETLILWQRVRELHHNVSAHDAQYVALAEALSVPLVTSDARIQRSGAAKCSIEVFSWSREATFRFSGQAEVARCTGLGDSAVHGRPPPDAIVRGGWRQHWRQSDRTGPRHCVLGLSAGTMNRVLWAYGHMPEVRY